MLSLNKPTIFKNNEFIFNSDKRFATRTGPHLQYLNQNKLETQHVVRINTVYNRKEKKGAREEREERGDGKLNTCASCQSKSTRCENADNNGKWRRALDLFLKGIYNIMCYKNEISNGENLTPARAVNQNRRGAKTLITANGGGVR